MVEGDLRIFATKVFARFARKERLDDLKKLAKQFLNYSEEQIATAVKQTELREVFCDDHEKP
jgi:hypothetical protein